MKKVAILRFLTAVGAALTTLASLDLTGIAELFDDGKPNKSFKLGLLCLLFLLIPLPFLGSCAPQPFSSGVVTEDGRFTLRPDGRIEVIIEPRASK